MSSAVETDVLSRGASGGGAEKSLKLPKASVKRMMKLSDETVNVSVESVVIVSKVTEEFLDLVSVKCLSFYPFMFSH